MDARCSEIEARRLFSEMALGGIDTSESRKIAQNAQLRFESTVKPWVKAELAAAQGGDDLDLMASWYIMYQPELLKRLGVNFAKLESVHRG